MVNWVLLAAVFACSTFLTGIVMRLSRQREWLDNPVARSSHVVPTPTSGGIAMLLPFIAAVLFLRASGIIDHRITAVFLGATAVSAVGLLDDRCNLSAVWRLPVQVVSALWVLYWVGAPAAVAGSAGHQPGIVVQVLAVVSFVWFINLFNFMDGIDGLAASEAVFVTLLSLLLVSNAQDQAVSQIAAVLGVAALGFLLWNWPRAAIFMGDVGSNFLGYSLASLAVISIANGTITVWSWLLLFGVFLVDATYTLIYRLLDGQRWFEAHNRHGYQQAAKILSSHRQVTLAVVAINLVWLGPLAWLANRNADIGIYLTVLGLTPLALIANRLAAGTARHEEPCSGESG